MVLVIVAVEVLSVPTSGGEIIDSDPFNVKLLGRSWVSEPPPG